MNTFGVYFGSEVSELADVQDKGKERIGRCGGILKQRACRCETRPFGEGRGREPVCGKGYANEIELKEQGFRRRKKIDVV